MIAPRKQLQAPVFQPANITAKLPGKRDSRFVVIYTPRPGHQGEDSDCTLDRLARRQFQQYNSDKRRSKMASSSYQSKMVGFQSPAVTPTRSPSKRPIMITQRQKQALIDNLQLESKLSYRRIYGITVLMASQSLNERGNSGHNTHCKRKICAPGWNCASTVSPRRCDRPVWASFMTSISRALNSYLR